MEKNTNIKIKINSKEFDCKPGETVLSVARRNGIYIPALCHHPDLPAHGNCRVCLVEITGRPRLVTSCSTTVVDGMEVFTESEKVAKARKINLELIFAEHIEKCPTCVWSTNCALLKKSKEFGVDICRFKDRKSKRKVYKFANAVELDGTQCIDCRNCLSACSLMQKIDYLELKDRGAKQEIVPKKNKKFACIYCGQCALHCPVGAAQEQTQWEVVDKYLASTKKIIVAQIAPSVRASIGEEFGLPAGTNVTGKLISALKKIGFDYVFDVNYGADITTLVEAEELLERVKKGKGLPMFTSCCPAWVRYVEFYRPDLIPNLTNSRSPHIHFGGAIKTYWAKKNELDPRQIIVVSIMPCTAKKYEASRPELKAKGVRPVDFVLTVRETAYLIKKHGIDFNNLFDMAADSIDGDTLKGSGVIYGASGGVMESAVRAASYMACGKETKLCRSRLELKEARGLEGVKEAAVDIGGKKLRLAIVNGIGHVDKVLADLSRYDYIEVMACPGGCIGGGGQPIPTNDEIRKKRMEALYRADEEQEVRRAYDNTGAKKIIEWAKKNKRPIISTKYFKNKK